MKEIYKLFEVYQNHKYEVSNYGNVKIDDKEVSYDDLTSWGNYKELWWHMTVHKAVALLYVENPENKPEIDHIDGNPLNNRADNIRWCTHSENLSNGITKERMKKGQQLYFSNPENRKRVSDQMKLFCKTERGKELIRKMVQAAVSKTKGVPFTEEHKKKIADGNRGKKFSEERKDNIRKATIEAMKRPEVREKCRKGGLHFRGIKWMNNGKTSIRVELDRVDEFLEKGYFLGRGKIKFNNNDGEQNRD